jgi:hypothetical protein
MGKKYFGMTKNDKANMPSEVVIKSYPKKNFAIMEGGYTDTQQELDSDYNKDISKVRKIKSK